MPMTDTVIKLITSGERYQDNNGIWRNREGSEREIFARVGSVGRNEFFSAGEAGFRPEFQFTIFDQEYRGEALCEYEGTLYSIYRTYNVPGSDALELYVQRKVGVNNGA